MLAQPTATIMECTSTKPNSVCSAAIGGSLKNFFHFFFLCAHLHVFLLHIFFFARVLTQFSDCCKLESEKLDSKR